jgi:putative membrane protein
VHPYAWSADPDAVFVAPALLVAYLVATRFFFPAPRWRTACFCAGVALLFFAFVSPLETLALHYLLAMHLLQNVVIAEWAPALCVLGVPPALAAALARLPLVRALTNPIASLPLWLVTYFAWHLPWPYDFALRHPNSLLHLEHASYFVAGTLFWWPVLQDHPRRLRAGARALYLFAAFVLASPLGLLLALLPNAVYSFYKHAPRLWGLTPTADQQIAGVTMAGEQAVVFFAAFTVFFRRFLHDEDAVDRFRAPAR